MCPFTMGMWADSRCVRCKHSICVRSVVSWVVRKTVLCQWKFSRHQIVLNGHYKCHPLNQQREVNLRCPRQSLLPFIPLLRMTTVQDANKQMYFHVRANVCQCQQHEKVTAGLVVQVIKLFSCSLRNPRVTGNACLCPMQFFIMSSCVVGVVVLLRRAIIPMDLYHPLFLTYLLFRCITTVLKCITIATCSVDVYVADLYYSIYVCNKGGFQGDLEASLS